MRRILQKGNVTERNRRNKLIWGIFLVIIMLLSTIGYAFYSSVDGSQTQEEIEYNEVTFSPNYGRWTFAKAGIEYNVRYNPLETKNVSVMTSKSIGGYYGQPVYIGPGTNSLGTQELLLNLANVISRQNMACLDENCTYDYPVKSCETDNIFIYVNSSDMRIEEEAGCVYLYSPVIEQDRVTDAFLFEILNI